ncbi:Amino acid adenylation domain-containing protein [Sulfidibacter corallicola]|uniref:Amino acid adenylation domain-containing protein n=1 Tax=Sulfidibacter corallicola TaxID=2818388 RepID=A0A8A4TN88_SULCO|nr:non-ribosomal peptide synthetase [Sulfidibacter corallicola]QTD50361.1 amino acid adenylation domain-containing protein [Sulfidibacter corallicola]
MNQQIKKNIEDIYELTPIQEGLLFHTVYAPGSGAYLQQYSFELQGPWRPELLRRAWEILVARHPILRTSFHWEKTPKPLQVVHKAVDLPWTELDWRERSQAGRRTDLEALMARERAEDLDTKRPPLMRLTLIRTGPHACILVWSFHHLLLDGWSMARVMAEVGQLWHQLDAGKTPSLAPSTPFRAYVLWLQQQDRAAAQAWWRANLAGFRRPLALMPEREAQLPQDATARYASVASTLPADSIEAARAFCRDRQITLNTFYEAVLALILSRYHGRDDVLFGANMATRPPTLTGSEAIVGPLINTVPVRIRVSGAQTVEDWLHDLQQGALNRERYAFCSLVDIQSWSEVAKGSPLFQIISAFESYPKAKTNEDPESGLRIENVSLKERINYPVSITLVPDDEVRLDITFDRDLFEKAEIQRLHDQVAHLFDRLPKAAAHRLDSISLLSPAEAAILLPPAAPSPAFRDVSAWFSQTVERFPRAVALREGPRTWTYAELEGAVAALTVQLRAELRDSESRVGLCCGRSAEMVVGMLAISAAGGICLPLEPEYPDARLAQWCAETQPALILAERGQVARLRALGNEAVWDLTPAPDTFLDTRTRAYRAEIHPDQGAYLMYTSGSTGKPKSVLIPHRALSNHMAWMKRTYPLAEDDRVLQKTPFTFDASVWEFWAPLLSGAQLVLAPAGAHADLNAMIDIVREAGITVLQLVPSIAQLLFDLPDFAGCTSLRRIFCGGEPLTPSLQQVFFQASGTVQADLINLYGPTETCIDASSWLCRRGCAPCLGFAIDHLRLLVLDRAMRPVPPGIPGEICIGGEGLARGYFGDPVATALKFVPDPFTGPEAPGSRLYRTGDWARRDPCYDGQGAQVAGPLIYQGRLDDQLKINGQRVEAVEIETALCDHPGVRQAAVAIRCLAGEDRDRLLAWVQPRAEKEEDAPGDEAWSRELRQHLEERLPRGWIPSLFTRVTELPRHANGKLDRTRLPNPEPVLTKTAERLEPMTPTERRLTEIWCDLLGIAEIGIHDNFFELGGDSIRCIQIVARAHLAGLRLTPKDMFAQPTIAALATLADNRPSGRGSREPDPGWPDPGRPDPGRPDPGWPDPTTHDFQKEDLLEQEGLETVVDRRSARDPFPLANLTPDRLALLKTQYPDYEDVLRLSPLQEGFLFHTLLEPEQPIYFEQASIELVGELDGAALKEAWQAVINHHTITRTAFAWRDLVDPHQVVLPAVELPWREEDWREMDESDQEARLQRFLDEDRSRGFELSRAPLMRCALFRLSDDRFRFVFSHHHLLMDGWSLPILFRQVLTAHAALLAGIKPSLAAAPPYRAFIHWLAGRDREAARDFWCAELNGFTRPNPLPGAIDMVGPRKDGEGTLRRLHRTLEESTTTALTDWVKFHRVTLNAVVQACWAFLLARYLDQRDIVFGTTVAGRPADLPDAGLIIGPFINTVPVRVRMAHAAVFADLAGEIQHGHMRRGPYDWASLKDIRDWSDVDNGSPLFRTLLVMENTPLERSFPERALGWQIRTVEAHQQTNFPLSAMVVPGPRLGIHLSWRDECFPPGAMPLFLDRLMWLLGEVVHRGDRPLGSWPPMSESERHRVLVTWNQTDRPPTDDGPLHLQIEDRAETAPQAIALRHATGTMTYADLNKHANRLAHHLIGRNLGPEHRIAVCLPRGFDLIVAILGIMKAGAAFVPLDVAQPRARRLGICSDADVDLVITNGNQRESFVERGLDTLLVDGGMGMFGREYEHNPVVAIDPANLAYVLFTSGSTGRPKGIAVTHRNLTHFISWLVTAYPLKSAEGVTLHTSPAFDASLASMFGVLVSGKTLLLVSEGDALGHLADLMDGNREASQPIAMYTGSPAQLEALMQLWRQRTDFRPNIEFILVGGELLKGTTVAALRDLVPNAPLANCYGPTEATVATTYFETKPGHRQPANIPIGRPIANARVYLLDRHMEPVAPGRIGELFIGGDGIARGYLGQSRTTAEAFVPDPFSGEPGARLYRSGDLCRHQADASGDLIFVRRRDSQVQVRGFRVEMGEIERALAEQPGVHTAAVAATRATDGQLELSAFVVPQSPDWECVRGRPLSGEALRRALGEVLPNYMLPLHWFFLDTMPMNANEKTDYRTLKRMVAEGLLEEELEDCDARQNRRSTPRDRFELELIEIWRLVLDRDDLGRDDDFFERGGNSLRAVRLMSQIQSRFRQNQPLREILANSRLADMARLLRLGQDPLPYRPLIALQPIGDHPPLILIHPAGGDSLAYLDLARQFAPDRPVYGVQPKGLEKGDPEAPDTIEAMAQDYATALLQQFPETEFRLAGASFGGLVAYETAAKLVDAGARVAWVGLLDTHLNTEPGEDDDAAIIAAFFEEAPGFSLAELRQIPAEELPARVLRQAAEAGILPADFGETRVRAILEMTRHSMRAVRQYQPRALEVAVTQFRASETSGAEDESLGWRTLLGHRLEVIEVSGNHQSMFRGENAAMLAEQIAKRL